MIKIEYRKISLFNAPVNSVIVHGCNAQGVWGSGIAKEFKERFPLSFDKYNHYCTTIPNAVGTSLILPIENSYRVGCLITSTNYGSKVDSPEIILKNTENALEDLVERGFPAIFYSNKFNSGLFKVPWEKTEQLIENFINKYNIDWVVCCPDGDQNDNNNKK